MNFKKLAYLTTTLLPLLLINVQSVFANGEHNHEDEVEKVSSFVIDEFVRTSSVKIALIAGVILVILVLISFFTANKGERFKKILFGLMVTTIVLPTIYFALSTIYLNLTSQTRGPIHWHADYRIFVCGEEIFLKSPEELSNRVGTAVFHHHDDARIHVEGVVVTPSDVSLSAFFKTIGGKLAKNSFSIPAEEGLVVVKNGDTCPDGGRGIQQVFLYKTEGRAAVQSKLEDYTEYVLSPEASVPPGDCIIFEFDEPKEKTNYMCRFYEIERDKGELEIR